MKEKQTNTIKNNPPPSAVVFTHLGDEAGTMLVKITVKAKDKEKNKGTEIEIQTTPTSSIAPTTSIDRIPAHHGVSEFGSNMTHKANSLS
jgi:hypothetical protein